MPVGGLKPPLLIVMRTSWLRVARQVTSCGTNYPQSSVLSEAILISERARLIRIRPTILAPIAPAVLLLASVTHRRGRQAHSGQEAHHPNLLEPALARKAKGAIKTGSDVANRCLRSGRSVLVVLL